MKHIKKAVLLLALFLMLPATAKAQYPELRFQDFRPHLAESQEHTWNLSIPLLPYMGSTNYLQYSNIGNFVKAFSGFQAEGDNPLAQMQSVINSVNKFHGLNANMNMIALELIKLNVNTKYFRLKLNMGAMSFNTARITGLQHKLSAGDIQMDENLKPFVNTGGEELARFTTSNLLGGEVWAIGKYPVQFKQYIFEVMFGVGSAMAYRYQYSYGVMLEETLGVGKGFETFDESVTGFLWNFNMMAGLGFWGYKYIEPKVVFEFRNIYNSERGPGLDFGIGTEVKFRTKHWKDILTLRADIYNVQDPEYRVEVSRKFWGNNEFAVGGVLRSRYPGPRNFGYAMVGLGGKLVKVTMTSLFSYRSFGFMFGVDLGYLP